MWWKSAVNLSFFLSLAAVRTRSSDWDMRSRPCVRCMRCCSAFPLVPGLGSAHSATGRPALFVGFTATMPRVRLLWIVHRRLRLLAFPLRTTHPEDGLGGQSRDLPVPVQRASVHARVSDHAGSAEHSPNALIRVAFRNVNAVGTRDIGLSRLNGWPARSPADASPASSGGLRTAWGRYGLLALYRNGFAPSTPCRSPGALTYPFRCE